MAEKQKNPLMEAVNRPSPLHNALEPIAHIHRSLQHFLKPTEELQCRFRQISSAAEIYRPQLNSALQDFNRITKEFSESFQNLGLGSFGDVAQRIAENWHSTKALEDAAWLPHYSTPFTILRDYDGDIPTLRMCLEKHYQENWREIRQVIEAQLEGYDIDDEAKATMREALTAHENRLYRSVCRVLMPEIERVSRKELHGDKVTERITNQTRLIELAGELSMTAVEPGGFYSLTILERLSEHLYQHINDDDDRQRFAKDPVPNRHAAVHGLVIYSTMQNSLNTIFMADYIFQIISLLKNSSDQSDS